MFCKKCGAELENDVTVCPECGAEIDFEEISEQDDFEIKASRRDKLEEIKERRDRKRKKEQKKRVIAVIILVAAIIAAAGGVLAWLSINFGDSVVIEDTQKTAVPVDSVTDNPMETPDTEPTEVPEFTDDPDSTVSPAIDQIDAPEITSEPTDAPVSVTQAPVASKTSKPAATKKASTPKPAAAQTTAATQKPNTSAAVPMGTEIQSKYVELEQVFPQEGSGVDIMSFRMGNEIYYANVNKGTTTGQIEGRYNYITAHATEKSFNGKPVYEITSMTSSKPNSTSGTANAQISYDGDYVLANSSAEYVTDAQLNTLTKSQLSLARNEIYARHGRKFKSSSLQSYFESKSWYKVNPEYNYSNDSANLTQIEKTNVQKIQRFESAK